ncbi:RNA polymerase-binding protein DksA [Nitrosomonas sp. HPC101]|uniref:RNA polymerase-binding protein DksA n=1 Tax=Nitrosomonas sp. HPC101 TaxID=1658667 RepID=UPI00136AEA72|nr:RNA polymerase-binding protein DksA [Nitrosomonas sp. HPC101]MXS85418.1 RNA polymerase-binding protein DksA [Nitrosomonas sp. HPC101]
MKNQPEKIPEDLVPPGEYMSPAQLAFFRQRLEQERSALLENTRNTLEEIRGVNTAPDPSDRASMEEKLSLELRVRNRERKLLGKIDEALQRIENDNYGWCVETGEPIGIPRLLARPVATLCIEAQERHELIERNHRS